MSVRKYSVTTSTVVQKTDISDQEPPEDRAWYGAAPAPPEDINLQEEKQYSDNVR
jgi:hypothetical protein